MNTNRPLTPAASFGKAVHLTRDGGRFDRITYCTGRSIDFMEIQEPGTAITCKACVKRAHKDGIEIETAA